jgi:magnesium chelatase subunit I
VKDEMRANLIARLKRGERLFPGVRGYEETVVPQIVNAVLSRHNMILLGLRGQAKSRILRQLSGLLDDGIPIVEGCEINDDPFRPICRRCRDLIGAEGDRTPVAFRSREERYVEKLATPDVTIADMIGDIDPIRAAKEGHTLASELTIHFGLLPRANRGIFAINELPDLAGKIQVGLFNIMQEGDVQIKGYPLRLPLDIVIAFSANPEDYTARGKIVTPLKDRIGSEIRTHYPENLEDGMEITAQEAWTDRGVGLTIPLYLREIVEAVAFRARADQRIDKRSGVSQRLPISCLETVASNAERRALVSGEASALARVSDIHAAVSSITGKLELEYEGELKGAESVARDLIRQAIQFVFRKYFPRSEFRRVTDWFENGASLRINDTEPCGETIGELKKVDGLLELAGSLDAGSSVQEQVAAAEFVLEGLCALDKIARSEEGSYSTVAKKQGIDDLYRDYAMDPKRFKKPLN